MSYNMTVKEVIAVIISALIIFYLPIGFWYRLALMIAVWVSFFPSDTFGNASSILAYFGCHNLVYKLSTVGLKIDKTDPLCNFHKTDSLVALERFEEAKQSALDALSIEKDQIYPYYQVWLTTYLLQDFDEAYEHAQTMVEKFPKDWQVYNARGLTAGHFLDEEKHKQMLEDYKEFSKPKGNDEAKYLMSTSINMTHENIDQAIESCEKAFKHYPSNSTRVYLAYCYLGKYDLEKVQELLEPLTKKKVIPEAVIACRAWLFAVQDMFEATLRDIAQLEKWNDPELLCLKGDILMLKNELTSSYNIALELLKKPSRKLDGLILNARILFSLDRYEDALKIIEECESINKNSTIVLIAKAHALKEMKEYESSIEYSDKAISINKYSLSAARIKVLAYIGLDDITEAEKWNEYADEIFFDNSFSWSCHGSLALAKKNDSLALEHFTRAIESNPHERFNYKERAQIYERLGKEEEAKKDKEAYEKIMSKLEEEGKHIP